VSQRKIAKNTKILILGFMVI